MTRIPQEWQTPLLLIALLVIVALLGSLAAPAMQRTVTKALGKLTVLIRVYIFVRISGSFLSATSPFWGSGGTLGDPPILAAKKQWR